MFKKVFFVLALVISMSFSESMFVKDSFAVIFNFQKTKINDVLVYGDNVIVIPLNDTTGLEGMKLVYFNNKLGLMDGSYLSKIKKQFLKFIQICNIIRRKGENMNISEAIEVAIRECSDPYAVQYLNTLESAKQYGREIGEEQHAYDVQLLYAYSNMEEREW